MMTEFLVFTCTDIIRYLSEWSGSQEKHNICFNGNLDEIYLVDGFWPVGETRVKQKELHTRLFEFTRNLIRLNYIKPATIKAKGTFMYSCIVQTRDRNVLKSLEDLDYNLLFSARHLCGDILHADHGYANTFDSSQDVDLGHIDISCGTNVELFLSIAAIRSDSDYGQWFCHKTGSFWFKVTDKDVTFEESFNQYNDDPELKAEDFHKAGIEELVKLHDKFLKAGTDCLTLHIPKIPKDGYLTINRR